MTQDTILTKTNNLTDKNNLMIHQTKQVIFKHNRDKGENFDLSSRALNFHPSPTSEGVLATIDKACSPDSNSS